MSYFFILLYTAYDMRLFKILRDDMHEGKNKLLGIKLQI